MANATIKKPKSIKGVYEMPADSGIWWINYYIEGRRFREKVGRRSDAITLYQRRKTDARTCAAKSKRSNAPLVA